MLDLNLVADEMIRTYPRAGGERIERVGDWVGRHSKDGDMVRAVREKRNEYNEVTTTGQNEWLFPDGAKIVVGVDGRTVVYFEPHEQVLARLQACRLYQSIKQERFETAFTQLKAALSGEGSPFNWDDKLYGPNPGDEKEALLLLRKKAHAARHLLKQLDAEIEALPEVVEKATRAKEQARRTAAAKRAEEKARQRRLEELNAIEL